MKRHESNKNRFSIAAVLLLLVLAAVTMLAPNQALAAATSLDATIINVVDVKWSTGTGTYHKQAVVTVKVALLAVAPTLTAIPGKTDGYNRTVAPGTFVTYSTLAKSNSNGPDTYTISQGTQARVNIGDEVTESHPVTSFNLFGGYIAVASGSSGVIKLPGGTTGLANDDLKDKLFIIGGNIFKVTASTIGAAPSGAKFTTIPEPLSGETYATVTLATVTGGQWGFTAGDPADLSTLGPGTLVSEIKAVGTSTYTVGYPTESASIGTYSTPYTFTTSGTNLAGEAQTASVTFDTRVRTASLEITKYFRTLTNGVTAFNLAGTGIDPANDAAAMATAGFFTATGAAAGQLKPKPTQKIQYLIIVKNASATETATNTTIFDSMPSYSTYDTSSTIGAYGTDGVDGGSAVTLANTGLSDSSGNCILSVSPGKNYGSLAPGKYIIASYTVTVK